MVERIEQQLGVNVVGQKRIKQGRVSSVGKAKAQGAMTIVSGRNGNEQNCQCASED